MAVTPDLRQPPNTLPPSEALHLIQLAMSGEQDSDTFNTIEGILDRAGYPVRDTGNADEQE